MWQTYTCVLTLTPLGELKPNICLWRPQRFIKEHGAQKISRRPKNTAGWIREKMVQSYKEMTILPVISDALHKFSLYGRVAGFPQGALVRWDHIWHLWPVCRTVTHLPLLTILTVEHGSGSSMLRGFISSEGRILLALTRKAKYRVVVKEILLEHRKGLDGNPSCKYSPSCSERELQ